MYDFTTPSGTNLNGVANFIIPDPDDPQYIFSCTATRIGARSILTAAHCVTDENTGALLSTAPESFARFLMPGSTDLSPKWYYTTGQSQVIVNPLWQGFNNPNTYLATDMAVVNFGYTLPSWITTYGLYTAFPLGQATENVGYGTYGNGVGPEGFDFGRRWGTNTVDYTGTDPLYSDYLDLYTDFDDPAGVYDTFCFFGVCSGGGPGDRGWHRTGRFGRSALHQRYARGRDLVRHVHLRSVPVGRRHLRAVRRGSQPAVRHVRDAGRLRADLRQHGVHHVGHGAGTRHDRADVDGAPRDRRDRTAAPDELTRAFDRTERGRGDMPRPRSSFGAYTSGMATTPPRARRTLDQYVDIETPEQIVLRTRSRVSARGPPPRSSTRCSASLDSRPSC